MTKPKSQDQGDALASGQSPKGKHAAEDQPAAEWGQRVATGKEIARGGKSGGAVPGASEQPERTEDER